MFLNLNDCKVLFIYSHIRSYNDKTVLVFLSGKNVDQYAN